MDINSFSGFSPVIGPQHNFAGKDLVIVSILFFFLNEGKDLKLFNLLEYSKKVRDQISIYTRLQFIYNHSLTENNHNKSYVYLRGGIKKGLWAYGLALNFDWSGPYKFLNTNHGIFVRLTLL